MLHLSVYLSFILQSEEAVTTVVIWRTNEILQGEIHHVSNPLSDYESFLYCSWSCGDLELDQGSGFSAEQGSGCLDEVMPLLKAPALGRLGNDTVPCAYFCLGGWIP
jgi:hypothetical protein